jgi:tRNA(Ile)-lysidine synthase
MEGKFLVAYSGGMDSHVLLHSLALLRASSNLQIRAVHVHHNLSPNADQWVTHCQQICTELNIELLVKHVDANRKSKHSKEAFARELRYQAIAEILQPDERLLTAHHADDQAETFLLQVFRGAGLKGLAAMPEHKSFHQGSLIRPLLSFTRAELHSYATQHKLKWIEDESNENIGIERNFVRHQLMPIIKNKWPGIVHTIGRVTNHCAEASHLLNFLAAIDYAQVQGSKPNTLTIKKLLELDSARQSNVIRYWLRQLNLPTPSAAKLDQIKQDALHSADDAAPLIHWSGAEIRRYQDNLYAMPPLAPHNPKQIINWDGKTPLVLPNKLGTLQPELLAELPTGNITVRFRLGGEKCRIKNRQGNHSLKNLMQEWQIPPWQRDRVPLIYADDKLAAISVGDSCHLVSRIKVW